MPCIFANIAYFQDNAYLSYRILKPGVVLSCIINGLSFVQLLDLSSRKLYKQVFKRLVDSYALAYVY